MPPRSRSRSRSRDRDAGQEKNEEQLAHHDQGRPASKRRHRVPEDESKKDSDKHGTKGEASERENHRKREESAKGKTRKKRDDSSEREDHRKREESSKAKTRRKRDDSSKRENHRRGGDSSERENHRRRRDSSERENHRRRGESSKGKDRERRGESSKRVRPHHRTHHKKRHSSAPAVSHFEDTEGIIMSGLQPQIFKGHFSKSSNPPHHISVHVAGCFFGQHHPPKKRIYECLLVLKAYVEEHELYEEIVVEIEFEPEMTGRLLVPLSDFAPEDHVVDEAIEEQKTTKSISGGASAPAQVDFNVVVNVAKESTLRIKHRAAITGSKTNDRKNRGTLKFITTAAAPRLKLPIPSRFTLWGKFEYKERKGLKLRVLVTATIRRTMLPSKTETRRGEWQTVKMHEDDMNGSYDVVNVLPIIS